MRGFLLLDKSSSTCAPWHCTRRKVRGLLGLAIFLHCLPKVDIREVFVGSTLHCSLGSRHPSGVASSDSRSGHPNRAHSLDELVRSSVALADIEDLSWTRYAFMLPVSIVVATCCQLAGIGGAALFSPIFILIFPLLGPQFPLASSAQAIASALLTEVFGFSSGLSGYARRGLVEGNVAGQYALFAAPAAFAGALCLGYVAADARLLRGVYACLMLGLSAFLAFSPSPAELARIAEEEECAVESNFGKENNSTAVCSLTSEDGRTFEYREPQQGSLASVGATLFGGFLTGLLGVGIGEVVLPQLLRSCCMPLPLAAGTSVATVVCTAAAAALVQFSALANATGGDLTSAVPLRLVCFTIPGVLIGGQIAPALAGRLPDDVIQRSAAAVFLLVGLSFLAAAISL